MVLAGFGVAIIAPENLLVKIDDKGRPFRKYITNNMDVIFAWHIPLQVKYSKRDYTMKAGVWLTWQINGVILIVRHR